MEQSMNNSGFLDGRTRLHVAVCNGDLDYVKMLLQKGADITQKDKDGNTALDLARQAGHVLIVKYLETCKPFWGDSIGFDDRPRGISFFMAITGEIFVESFKDVQLELCLHDLDELENIVTEKYDLPVMHELCKMVMLSLEYKKVEKLHEIMGSLTLFATLIRISERLDCVSGLLFLQSITPDCLNKAFQEIVATAKVNSEVLDKRRSSLPMSEELQSAWKNFMEPSTEHNPVICTKMRGIIFMFDMLYEIADCREPIEN